LAKAKSKSWAKNAARCGPTYDDFVGLDVEARKLKFVDPKRTRSGLLFFFAMKTLLCCRLASACGDVIGPADVFSRFADFDSALPRAVICGVRRDRAQPRPELFEASRMSARSDRRRKKSIVRPIGEGFVEEPEHEVVCLEPEPSVDVLDVDRMSFWKSSRAASSDDVGIVAEVLGVRLRRREVRVTTSRNLVGHGSSEIGRSTYLLHVSSCGMCSW